MVLLSFLRQAHHVGQQAYVITLYDEASEQVCHIIIHFRVRVLFVNILYM